jgi:hypothetical protein
LEIRSASPEDLLTNLLALAQAMSENIAEFSQP